MNNKQDSKAEIGVIEQLRIAVFEIFLSKIFHL